jgi:hypothetical protein
MRVTTTMESCRFALALCCTATAACGADTTSSPEQMQGPATGVGGSGPTGAAAGASGAGRSAPPATSAGRGPGAAPVGTAGTAGAATSGAIPTSGTAGMGGGAAEAGSAAGVDEPLECDLSKAPAEFESNPSIGGGGGQATESAHFRIVGASGDAAMAAIDELEAAYSCFVETLCWRSSGLSFNDDSDAGPYYKMNIYSVGSLGSAAGQMFSDAPSGLSYLRVVGSYLPDPKVTVHEYGHALTYHEQGWVEQTRTGAWWETVANFVADTYMTSPICAPAREKHNVSEGETIIDLRKVLGDSHQVLVDGSQGSGNYYQAWPFLTYLTNNPDGYAGLGKTALREMFREHNQQNETPLHVLERVAQGTKVQQIVGRYWAHMAYVDIGHKQAQEAFQRNPVKTANLDAAGGEMFSVKSNRAPRYMGANIIPLTASGAVTVKVTASGGFTATLAIRASSGTVRYVDLPDGAGQAMVESGEEASLVVANTPDMLIQYDPFSISGDAGRGLDYQVQLTGAMPN